MKQARTLIGLLLPIAIGVVSANVSAQSSMSVNGYSGLGITPSAWTLDEGTSVYQHSRGLPGASPNKGHNFIAAYGLTDEWETSFRLATQDLRCNWYAWGCPPVIRDISGSVKYSPKWKWLQDRGWRVALGASDIGGAATNFRSYYAVAGTHVAGWELDMGIARKQSSGAPLDGPFLAARKNVWQGIDAGLEWVRNTPVASLQGEWRIPYTSAHFQLGVHATSGDDKAVFPKQWSTMALVFPLDGRHQAELDRAQQQQVKARPPVAVQPVTLPGLVERLHEAGLPGAVLSQQGTQLRIVVENQRFPLNDADALATALAVAAGLPQDRVAGVEVIVTRRGWPLVWAQASPQCLADALRADRICSDLRVHSAVTRPLNAAQQASVKAAAQARSWSLRPEIVLTPVINSRIGTEVNTWDADVALGVNLLLPLMKGVTLDVNHLESLRSYTREFRDGGQYAGERLSSGLTRAMVHGVWHADALRTHARLSLGRGYTEYKGAALETLTVLGTEGRMRLNLSAGQFKRGPRYIFGLPLIDDPEQQRDYHLASARWAWGAREQMTTELTAGRFWAEDRGYALIHRFWHGDAHVAVSFRRSQMADRDKPVAFAGITLAVPLTTRRDLGGSRLSLRGAPGWSYTVESKVLETDNIITAGYGEIPRFGEHLAFLLNRDRFHDAYWRTQLWRMREAALELPPAGSP